MSVRPNPCPAAHGHVVAFAKLFADMLEFAANELVDVNTAKAMIGVAAGHPVIYRMVAQACRLAAEKYEP